MRRFLLAAVMFGTVAGAQAADLSDLPILRGAFTDGQNTATVNWRGYYLGVQGAYASSDENFVGSNRPQIARLLSQTTIENEFQISKWPVMGREASHTMAFGAFLGHNSQWDDVVLGVEASYMHGKFGGSSTGSMGRTFTTSDNYSNDVFLTSSSSINISDFATLRLRAGYAIDNYLPYVFGGVALGRGDITQHSSVTASGVYVGTNIPAPPPYGPTTLTADDGQHNHLLYGYSLGLGVDVMLTAGLFLRAEYEYLRITASVDTNINTGRVGLGYKF